MPLCGPPSNFYFFSTFKKVVSHPPTYNSTFLILLHTFYTVPCSPLAYCPVVFAFSVYSFFPCLFLCPLSLNPHILVCTIINFLSLPLPFHLAFPQISPLLFNPPLSSHPRVSSLLPSKSFFAPPPGLLHLVTPNTSVPSVHISFPALPPLLPYLLILVAPTPPLLLSPALGICAACVCWRDLTDRCPTLSQSVPRHTLKDVSASPSVTSSSRKHSSGHAHDGEGEKKKLSPSYKRTHTLGTKNVGPSGSP